MPAACSACPAPCRTPPFLHPSRVQLVLEVEPLESGRSAEATGRLLLTRRDAAAAPAGGGGGGAASMHAPGSWRLCYKLGETGASYVAV